MIVIPRKSWGARFKAGFGPAPEASELWLHHSVTTSAGEAATEAQDAATVRKLEDIGQERFGGGISYTFAVCRSGRVFEGTGGLRVGAHTGGRNTRARAIVLIDDCTTRRPSTAAMDAVADLVRYGKAAGYWSVDRLTGGHRDAPNAATSCPGNAAWALIPVINSRAVTAHLADDEDDGEMTPEDRERQIRIEAGLTLLLQQMIGPGATLTEPWPGEARGSGWEHWRHNVTGPARLTLVDYVRAIDEKIRSGFTLDRRPNHPDAPDDLVGHDLSVHAYLADLGPMIQAIAAKLGVPTEGAGR